MGWKEVSDEFWGLVEPLLPAPKKHRIGGGRPRIGDRVVLNAILFVLTTGCQWKALASTHLCAPSTAHDRFQQWRRAGVFRDLWIVSLFLYDEIQGIDWRWLCLDGCMTKAPLAGTEDAGPNPTDRAKQGVKRSLLTDGAGIRLAVSVAGANRPDVTLALDTLDDIVVPRPRPNLEFPQGLCLDKGYDALWLRWEILRRPYDPHIRTRGEQARARRAEPGKKARRWPVERTHSWINRFRRLLIRWEKRTDNFLAMLHFAFALICVQRAAWGQSG